MWLVLYTNLVRRSAINSLTKREADYIEPMECLSVSKLPEGLDWLYEIKLDGYRAVAVRSGPAVHLYSRRRKSFDHLEKIRQLTSQTMPFANLPDKRASRWGESLTAEKMKECVWLRPEAVAQIEFLEWTDADRLRHSKFVGLRDDKEPRSVIKEYP
jgi:ATP-dependent DNA ligase